MKWSIWCKVQGGVTGRREAWLKRNGEIVEFATEEAAEAMCRVLRKQMNTPRAKSFFTYTPKSRT